LKYIKQLLNLCNDLRKQINHYSHVFTKAVNQDLAFEIDVWRINFILELLRGLVFSRKLLLCFLYVFKLGHVFQYMYLRYTLNLAYVIDSIAI
jgi:hypothetical protein